uniref:Uncharacterized protein n=1 Tax=Tanacetum cinerariifolium TaxID=118510 RepID=A0A6L2JXZ8_TANCI|nr:hypothetical protein [Tanacetum cinerariifolium]
MSTAIKKEPKKTVEEKYATFDNVYISNSMKKEQKKPVEQRWTTFDDDDENCHLILFAVRAPVSSDLLHKETERAWKTKGSDLFKLKDYSSYQDVLEFGHEHKFITEIVARRANECIVLIIKPDFKNLNKNDIEDMYLLIMNGKKVNLTAPTICFLGIKKHEIFSIIYEPVHGITYKNSKKEKRMMRHSEIYKFCNATLNRVLEGLKSYNNDVKYGYIKKDLTKDETEYVKLFKEEIELRLKYHMKMRRWEMYGNGRPLGPRRERPE